MIDVKKETELLESLNKAMKKNKDEECAKAIHEMMRFCLGVISDAINPIIPPAVPFLCASMRYMAQMLEEDHHASEITADLIELLKMNSMKVTIPVGKTTIFAEGGEEE